MTIETLYLLDTMVLSEGFKKRPDPGVMSWMFGVDPSRLFVSVMTFGEIEAGIEKQRSNHAPTLKLLENWLVETQGLYLKRTLPITNEVAIRWGRLMATLGRRDMDLLIAATALEHDLTIATRNVRHFEPTGVKLFNPYEV